MTYSAQTWVDNDPVGHPVSAARMGVIETGIVNAHYRPSARIYRSTTQAVADSTWTTMSYDSERFDTDATGMHAGGQPTRMVFQQSGIYLVVGGITFAANATGDRGVRLIKNGSTSNLVSSLLMSSRSSASGVQISMPTVIQATAGDYVELQAWQTSGSSMTIPAGTATTWDANDLMASLLSF